jgi:hypothetical protein
MEMIDSGSATASGPVLGHTQSICPRCRTVLDAELRVRGRRVILSRTCPDHGPFEAVVYGDADRYQHVALGPVTTAPLEMEETPRSGPGSGSSRRALIGALGPAMASLALAIAGCGGGDTETTSAIAPSASDFPSASGRPLSQIVAVARAGNSIVVSPTGRVFEKGPNRLGFGVFTASRRQITDAQMALYAAPSGGGPAKGPFPARVESLTTQPQFRSQTVATDPDAAQVVYVAHIDLNREGNWDLACLRVRAPRTLSAGQKPSTDARTVLPRRADRERAHGRQAPPPRGGSLAASPGAAPPA